MITIHYNVSQPFRGEKRKKTACAFSPTFSEQFIALIFEFQKIS